MAATSSSQEQPPLIKIYPDPVNCVLAYPGEGGNLSIKLCPVCHLLITCLNYYTLGIKHGNRAIVNMQIAPLLDVITHSPIKGYDFSIIRRNLSQRVSRVNFDAQASLF